MVAPQTPPIAFEPWPRDEVALPGWTLSVRTSEPALPGTEPAVLVHGLGGSSLNWTDLMGLLRDRLDSRAPDLPGFGYSPPPDDGDYTLTGHARAVIALIDQEARGPVHLFGNSLGGAVSTTVAARRPDLVRSLTLISPALPDLVPGLARLQVGLTGLPGVGGFLTRQLAKMSPEQRAEGLIRLVYGDPDSVPPERRREAAEEIERRLGLPYAQDALTRSAQSLPRAYLDRGPDSLWRLAERIECPVLVVYGRRDQLVHPRAAYKATRHFRDCAVVVLPQSGHVAQMEHPEQVAAAWRDHLGGPTH